MATSDAAVAARPTPTPPKPTPTPQLALALDVEDVALEPLPLRAGFPFTITGVLQNNSPVDAEDVPLLIHISALHEQIGYQPFLHVLTVTVPASRSVPITLPIQWNFGGGEHHLWMQVNRMPEAWYGLLPPVEEQDVGDNAVLLDLMIDPFDAYTSDLCAGRADLEVGPTDVLPEPEHHRVLVTVHNLGNQAVYNVPVVVLGEAASGIAYSALIPPCGGTVRVPVALDSAFEEGTSFDIQVNPPEWESGVQESNYDNNRVAVSAGLAPGTVLPAAPPPADYDFQISSADVESPQLWIVQVTVHNVGTRDADRVPLRVENEGGRKLLDYVPLVRGNGIGVTALRVGYLWTRGGTLTFTVNPADADRAYPEQNRGDNVATFQLP